jgi:hypothetical protein
MVSVHLHGGLANQLWEMAAAEYVADALGRPLVFLDLKTPINQHTVKNYFESILREWALRCSSSPVNVIVYEEQSYVFVGKEQWQKRLGHVPTDVLILLKGYLQNHNYILPTFVHKLTLPAINPIPNNVAFLHIRGGDYVHHWLHDVGLNDGTYYSRALALFPPDTHFYVFTNDYAYASTVSWIKKLPTHMWMNTLDEEYALATMAACPRGGICANSTFSWWASYINKTKGGVGQWVIPSKWFNDSIIYIDGYKVPGFTILSIS